MGQPLDWDTLIQERNAWVAHNFPDPDGSRTPLDSVLGCIEELGELTHAHLKQVQSIRGDSAHHEAAAKDSIGDLTVYLLGVMSYHKVTPRYRSIEHWEGTTDNILLYIAKGVGILAHLQYFGYGEGWPAVVEIAVTTLVQYLQWYCAKRGWDYEEIVQSTWDQVKQRDWIKWPDTGRPPAEEEVIAGS